MQLYLRCLPELFGTFSPHFGGNADGKPVSLPLGSAYIRIALIHSGGLRPWTLAMVFWRICITATMRALRPWLETWIPSQMFGGVPAKGILDLHEQLHDDLEETIVVGCKADVRRCF